MHPLISDLSGKTTEELLKTINDMYKKMAFANRMGNAAMKQQLQKITLFLKTVWTLANDRYELEQQLELL